MKGRRKRGHYADLIPASFISEMTGIPKARIQKYFARKLNKEGRCLRDLSPREIAEFVEEAYERSKASFDGDHIMDLLF